MEEIWKDISGYEGYYQVSSNGRVRSLDRITNRGTGENNHLIKGRILKNNITESGYLYVILSISGDHKHARVHRLMCQEFKPNPENKKCVNHINGVKDDNRLCNLEWATHSENNQHAYNAGLKKPNTTNGRNAMLRNRMKKVNKYSIDGIFIREYESISEAKILTKIDSKSIRLACNGVYSQAGGYLWKFKESE